MLSSFLHLLVLSSYTRSFEYHLFQRQTISLLFVSFSWVSSVMMNSFALVIFYLNCLLIFLIHGISGVLLSFSPMSPQNLKNFSLFSIWPTCSVLLFTFLKAFFCSPSNISIRYSSDSLNLFPKFNLSVTKFVT